MHLELRLSGQVMHGKEEEQHHAYCTAASRHLASIAGKRLQMELQQAKDGQVVARTAMEGFGNAVPFLAQIRLPDETWEVTVAKSTELLSRMDLEAPTQAGQASSATSGIATGPTVPGGTTGPAGTAAPSSPNHYIGDAKKKAKASPQAVPANPTGPDKAEDSEVSLSDSTSDKA